MSTVERAPSLIRPLEIRCHGTFDTKQSRVVEQFTVLYAVSLSRETQCFERDVQPELVPELKAIHDSACCAVDSQRSAVYALCLKAFVEGLLIELMHRDGYRQLDAVIAASWYSQMDGGGDWVVMS